MTSPQAAAAHQLLHAVDAGPGAARLTGVVIVGDHAVPRTTVLERAQRAARGLHEMGVREGHTVALLLRNDTAFLEATEAADLLGAYGVPVNWHLKADELRHILADCEARVLVVHADLLDGARPALPPGIQVLVEPTPDSALADYGIDPARAVPPPGSTVWRDWLLRHEPWREPRKGTRASMLYTSGTTGRPKAVRRVPATPEQVQARAALFRQIYGVAPDMRAMVAGPLYHTSPNGFARHALHASELLLLASRFDPQRMLADIERHGITHAVMVPTMFVRLLKLPPEVRARHDISCLRWVTHTAAPCPPEVKRALIDWWGPILHETYGATEIGLPVACTSEEWLAHPGSVGRATVGSEVAIYSDDGRRLGEGEIGEIYTRCSAYSDFTYHQHDEDRRRMERDGLISVGDVGYLRDGFLYLCDRKTDMVISGGVNIYPAEIETALLACPGVRDCAVYGVPDEDMGESLVAAVELMPGHAPTASELQAWLRARLASYKVPRRFEFHAQLPREDSGKIFKRKLKEPASRGGAEVLGQPGVSFPATPQAREPDTPASPAARP